MTQTVAAAPSLLVHDFSSLPLHPQSAPVQREAEEGEEAPAAQEEEKEEEGGADGAGGAA